MNSNRDSPGVISCIAALISAFRDADIAVQQLKERRIYSRNPPPPSTLEESIAEAPREVEREKKRGFERFGQAFQKGDYPAVIAIQQITIDVRSILLPALEGGAVVDDQLVHLADSARENAIAALTALRRRLTQAGSTDQTPSVLQSTRLDSEDVPPSLSVIPQMRPTRHFPLPPVQPYSSPSHQPEPDVYHSPPTQNPYPAQWDYMAPPASLQADTHLRSPTGTPRAQSVATPIVNKVPNDAQQRRQSLVLGLFRRGPSRPDNELNPTQDSIVEVDEDPFDTWSRRSSVPDMQRNDTRSSGTTEHSVLSTAATSVSSMPVRTVRTLSNTVNVVPPSPDNDYLGFCKGAYRMQNEDKNAIIERKDFRMSASNDVSFPSCSKCAFKGHEYTQLLKNKVRLDENRQIKYRWTFLAKSHVKQKSVTDQNYSYQCLFCVFLGVKNRVIYNESSYLDHVSKEHRWSELDDVVLNRTRCVNTRICKDAEKWDINLFPLSANEREYARKKQALSEDLGIGMPTLELSA